MRRDNGDGVPEPACSTAVRVNLASSVHSGRLVRRALEPLLASVPPDSVHSVLLVASEMVSNVVQHTSGPCVFRAWLRGRCLRVEITDHAPGGVPSMRLTATGEVGGHGLRLIDALSQGWGVTVDRAHSRKTVWAEISLDP